MRFLVLTFILFFFYANVLGQRERGYKIVGKIHGLPDGTVFYLITNKSSGGADTLSRSESKNEMFSFKGIVQLEAELYFIKMDTANLKVEKGKIGGRKRTWVRLLLDNSSVYLTGNMEDWPNVKVTGSSPTTEHDRFIEIVSPAITELNRDIDSSKKDSTKIAQAKNRFNQFYAKSFEKIPNSFAIPLFIMNNPTFKLDEREFEYEKLPRRLKESFYGKKLRQLNIAQRAGESIVVGKVLPDFNIKTVEGRSQSIRTIIAQSKFTLIDFWASWCVPCRREIPNLRKVYEAFNKDGFSIISISIDNNPVAWQKALSEENMPWANGLEQNKVSKEMFDIISIPAQILVNDKAEIVAIDYTKAGGRNQLPNYVILDKGMKRLRGDDLFKVVENLMRK